MAGPGEIGEQLKTLRARRGLTQIAAAEAIGIERSSLAHYERGARKPNLEDFLAIADFYKVTVDALETGTAASGVATVSGKPHRGKPRHETDEQLVLRFFGQISLEERLAFLKILERLAGNRG